MMKPERTAAPAFRDSELTSSRPSLIGPRHTLLRASVMAVALAVLIPIVSLGLIAMTGAGEDWPHLVRNVLPSSTATTVILLALVAISTAVIGTSAAYLVVAHEFPLRRILSWAIVLPLAVPPYLCAYALGEFFHYTGPVQSLLRAIFGFQTIHDYWFPDIRSIGGAALVFASVLYPYVYLTTRVVFLMQARGVADAARTLGANRARVLGRILLPLARPAIVAGSALVLMETLNDIGASEYLGVRTLTFSVYSTWLNRGSLAGGAQIALVLLAIVGALLAAEYWVRRKQRYAAGRSSQFKARPPRLRLAGWRGWAATSALLLPILVGFGIPVLVFGRYASRRIDQLWDARLGDALANSIVTAAAAALLTVGVALLLTYAAHHVRSRQTTIGVRLASIGYALPGGVLALGLMFVLAGFDNGIDAFARSWFGVSTGLLVTGSAGAVILACTIRFVALAEGALRSGYEKLPPNIEAAARSLGRDRFSSAVAVLLPLLTPAILTAIVLVFVDTVKELSATILLRPFGFNTLATYVYEQASRGVPEEGAMAALLIMATALVPVILLSHMLADDRRAD